MRLPRFGTSVGRRIALLVVLQALTLAFLIFFVFNTFQEINADLEYSGRYMLAPAKTLPDALEQSSSMISDLRHDDAATQAETLWSRLRQIERVMRRYQLEWGTEAPNADAVRRIHERTEDSHAT